MFKPLNENRSTFTTKVVEHIQTLIIEGKLKPGEKLPSERDLSQLMNVSRPTIREAFKILSALGFVHIKHGQGVYVKEHKERLQGLGDIFFSQKQSILDLFEMRFVIETQAAYWAAERASDELREKLLQLTNESYQTVLENEVDIPFLEQADHDFHCLVAEGTNNNVYISMMDNVIYLLKSIREHTLQIPGRPLRSLKEHQYIAQAIHARKPFEAKQFMYEHLMSVKENVTEHLDKQDTP